MNRERLAVAISRDELFSLRCVRRKRARDSEDEKESWEFHVFHASLLFVEQEQVLPDLDGLDARATEAVLDFHDHAIA